MGDVEKMSTKVHEDEREIVAKRFIEDDEFIKTPEFKDLLLKMKIKETQERMELVEAGIEESKKNEMVARYF